MLVEMAYFEYIMTTIRGQCFVESKDKVSFLSLPVVYICCRDRHRVYIATQTTRVRLKSSHLFVFVSFSLSVYASFS